MTKPSEVSKNGPTNLLRDLEEITPWYNMICVYNYIYIWHTHKQIINNPNSSKFIMWEWLKLLKPDETSASTHIVYVFTWIYTHTYIYIYIIHIFIYTYLIYLFRPLNVGSWKIGFQSSSIWLHHFILAIFLLAKGFVLKRFVFLPKKGGFWSCWLTYVSTYWIYPPGPRMQSS